VRALTSPALLSRPSLRPTGERREKPSAVVNLASMRDDQDDDQPVFIINSIDNTIIADAVSIGPGQGTSQWPDVRMVARIGL
jgi:hypothetical protein